MPESRFILEPCEDLAAEPLAEPVAGRTVGRYELVRKLANGGMAEIFLAHATGLAGFQKTVVIKRTFAEHATNVDFISMFLDEARLAATLRHPNIAQVFDVGIDGDCYYYAMEHLDGRDVRHLRRALRQHEVRLPLEHALHIAMGVAAALHSAHELKASDGTPLNVVHRDVSPANIMVTFDGQVKLIDFGIARAERRQTQTRVGILKGKSSYMSPEQVLCKPLDRRSDVFAIGILLYELTTGTRLFQRGSEFETMRQIVKEQVPPPSSRVRGYPAELERIVLRALAREVDDRFASAEELYLALEAFARAQRLVVSEYGMARAMAELFAAAAPASVSAADDERTEITERTERMERTALQWGDELELAAVTSPTVSRPHLVRARPDEPIHATTMRSLAPLPAAARARGPRHRRPSFAEGSSPGMEASETAARIDDARDDDQPPPLPPAPTGAPRRA